MKIVWLIPAYHAEFPKPCMNGWGRMFLTIAPDGTALPCPAASVIPDLDPPSVTDRSIGWIWYESRTFNRFRGFDWMSDPCRSCPRRFEDFGGCRCQAFLLAGDPAVTDPVCVYSPHRHLVTEAITTATQDPGPPAVYRAHRRPLHGRVQGKRGTAAIGDAVRGAVGRARAFRAASRGAGGLPLHHRPRAPGAPVPDERGGLHPRGSGRAADRGSPATPPWPQRAAPPSDRTSPRSAGRPHP